ncbi:unnamed protein product [Thlaspi arvense]|uniref:Uncharacterized protein n=1 Tax=Thlaspi arvense TaxID=13288 RepID=A0AAU9REH3_THLAR|nr:unnamed protein product [Thlaspi arvense]
MNRPLSLFNIALIAFLCLHYRVLSGDVLENTTELHHSPLVTQSESTVLDLEPSREPNSTPTSKSDPSPTQKPSEDRRMLESPVIADPQTPATPKTVVVVAILTVVVSVCVSIAYANSYFTGKRENEDRARAWATLFSFRGHSVLDKHFNLLPINGTEKHQLLRKEATNVFKFYASGRSKYCHGLLVTIELKSRHDLFSRLFNWVRPCKNEIRFEVYMNDKAMDHMLFVVARNEAAKTMHKELRDLQRFGGGVVPIPGGGRKWVSEELSVIAESEEVAADMITDAVLDKVFGDESFKNLGKYFISMHFSDQLPFKHRKMLLFKFVLPDNMNDLVRWLELIPYYIDLLGHYKLSRQARDKTKRARKSQGVRQERFISEKQSREGNIG